MHWGKSPTWIGNHFSDEEMINLQAFSFLEPIGVAVEDHRFGKILAEMNRLFNARWRIKDRNGENALEHMPGYDPVEREKVLKRIRSTRSHEKFIGK